MPFFSLSLVAIFAFLAPAQSFAGLDPVPMAVPANSTSSEVPTAPSEEWNIHFQATSVTQTHTRFHSPYEGQNSLSPNFEIPSTGTGTLFVGHRLWEHAYAFVNPEESMGAGISSAHGIAGFTNGEAFRVDNPNPITSLARLFIQQEFFFGGGQETIEDDLNQFATKKDVRRLTLVVGKFSLNDYFDENTYSHDPRTQFLNWALMDLGAWDYAADTRGYTWGGVLDLHLEDWSFRAGVAQEPKVANGIELEGDLANARSEVVEIERRYPLAGRPGKARILAFANQARMGDYRESINNAAAAGTIPDITSTRAFRTKYGFGINVEQDLTPDLGVFLRASTNDGATETWAFTEIDRALSFGGSLKGSRWSRQEDTVGLAFVLNGLSEDHRDYLAAGGSGFMIGDGALNYGPEEIIEAYYAYQALKSLAITLDFQGVNHPGYNEDRGPVAVFALRGHLEI